VLGANDGLVSTASLMVGVAAANVSASALLTTGAAGLVAGAMSMAAGEYVSVHTQADTEAADLARERAELEADPEAEARELAGIYVARGLQPELAQTVAAQLMAHDALGAHARDELGLTPSLSCAAAAGRPGIGRQLCGGCAAAAAGGAGRAGGPRGALDRGQHAGVAGPAGRRGGARRRRQHAARRRAWRCGAPWHWVSRRRQARSSVPRCSWVR
jgi:VIT1/CCC1 family predicted Fe2+/Mn2+ transporter